MATATKTSSIEQYLGSSGGLAAWFQQPAHFQGAAAPARSRLRGPRCLPSPTAPLVCWPTCNASFDHGRLGGTGYLSILPVDQGIEHSGGASFAKNPDYFDPENIVKLAVEAGCNAVASTFGVLGVVARKYAHKIPVHREDQSQRAAHLSQQVRADPVRHRRAGGRHGRGGRGRHHLFRLRRRHAPDRRGRPGLCPRSRAGHGDRALVLPAQPRLQEGQGLSRRRRSDRPGQSPRRHHPGRHHQAEAAGEQRRLQGAEHRAIRPTASSTSASTPS